MVEDYISSLTLVVVEYEPHLKKLIRRRFLSEQNTFTCFNGIVKIREEAVLFIAPLNKMPSIKVKAHSVPYQVDCKKYTVKDTKKVSVHEGNYTT